MSADLYTWWMSALELAGDYGVLSREQMYTLGVHEDDPQPGFYRVPPSYFVVDPDGTRRKRRESDGMEDAWVAIWATESGLAACVNGRPADPHEIWMSCCRAPVEETRFRKMEARNFGLGVLFGSVVA